MDHEFEFRTAAVQAGSETELASTSTGDVVVPIHLATAHEVAGLGEPEHGYNYARMGNPTRDALERRLARLEGADDAVAFASGTAAMATTCLSLLGRGDRLVAFESVYGGMRLLFEELLAEQFGVEIDYVDATDPEALRRTLTDDTAMLWVESPTNPLSRLCDLSAMSDVADEPAVAAL